MIIITLIGGKRDGEEHKISDEIWRSGYFKTVELPSFTFSFTTEIKPNAESNFKIIGYRRERWNPGWACLTEDWDGTTKPVHAAMPQYKWVLDTYKW